MEINMLIAFLLSFVLLDSKILLKKHNTTSELFCPNTVLNIKVYFLWAIRFFQYVSIASKSLLHDTFKH